MEEQNPKGTSRVGILKKYMFIGRCIVPLAVSTYLKGSAFNKLCAGLPGVCIKSPNDTIHAKH